MPNKKLYKFLNDLNKFKWNIALKSLLVGAAAGLLVVLYRYGIEFGTDTAIRVYAFLSGHPFIILPWILLIAAAGYFVAWLVKWQPMATGSGIPQVEGVLLFGLKMKGAFVLAVRFIAGILCSFFGLSLGREGPSIQIGAAAGQEISKKLSKNDLDKNYLITGGAAAGLSAAFNAPLSGIVFALEEVHRSFSPMILIAATGASLTADVVSKYFFGLKPVLNFTATPQLPVNLYPWLILLGVVTGLSGSLINKSLLLFQTLYNKLPAKLRPSVAFLIALPCGLFLPQVLGGGQNLIKMAESARSGMMLLMLLLTVKILFTSTSFGSGAPGGIFMPVLCAGALSGSVCGLIAAQFGLPAQYISDFAVCGMAGALASSVKAPVTGILLTAEMTGSLVHLLPVAACSFIALFLSDALKVKPIYEELLERYIEKNEDTMELQEKGGLIEFPVEPGCELAGKTISEMDWPEGALIVSLHRGTKELLPRGNTKILPGDYLMILLSKEHEDSIYKSIKSICHVD